MAVDVTISLVDAYSRAGSKRFEGVATTVAQAQLDAADLLVDFQAVSDMGTTMLTYSQSVPELNTAVAGANVDAGGTIHCRLNNGKGYALKVPAIKPSLVNPDGSIDISSTAITDLIAHFQTGGEYTVSEGDLIDSVLYGELDR